MRTLVVVLAVVAALGAVAVANVVLLGYGSERRDRVGHLSPRAPALAPAPQLPAAEHDDDDLDD